jgi:hypothetical protein
LKLSASSEGQGGEEGSAGAALVQVAYANDPLEAKMIHGLFESNGIPSFVGRRGMDGPLQGQGVLRPGFDGGARRVMVRADRAEEARALLGKTLAENEDEAWPEIANARHLENAGGRKPRDYGLAGAYTRIYFWSLGAIVVAFGVFLLLRAG